LTPAKAIRYNQTTSTTITAIRKTPMPTYEYECRECSHSFEAFQSMSDEPIKTCPECGREVRRLIFGGTGVIFKGSGFYVTDKNRGKNGSAKSGGAKTEGTSSGEAAAVSGDKTGSCATCPNRAPEPAASSGTGCSAGSADGRAASGEGSKGRAASAATA